MTSLILWTEEHSFSRICKGITANHQEFRLYGRVSGTDECINAIYELENSGADYALIYEYHSPASLSRKLFARFNEENLKVPMLVYSIAGDKVSFARSEPEFMPSILSVEELFLDCFADYSLDKAVFGLAGEEDAGVYSDLVLREKALAELLKGCSMAEFKTFRRKYNLDLRDGGYYLLFCEDEYGIEYYDHAVNKVLYSFEGQQLKTECDEALAGVNGGECVALAFNLMCVIINAPTEKSEAKKNEALNSLLNRLYVILSGKNSCFYVSEYVSCVTGFRQVYEAFTRYKYQKFFHVLPYESSVHDAKQFREMYDAIHDQLNIIKDFLRYDVQRQTLDNALRTLFFDIIAPAENYIVFYYCISDLYLVLMSEASQENMRIDAQLDPISLSFSSISEQYANILAIIDQLRQKKLKRQPSANAYITSTEKYIKQHIDEPITLSYAASRLHFSKAYFSRLFKKETGTSFVQYVIDCRIDVAAKLLKETNEPIETVAEKCGFNDSRYFARVFKARMQLSPREYRKKQNS